MPTPAEAGGILPLLTSFFLVCYALLYSSLERQRIISEEFSDLRGVP
jgi:hypothetical protein